MDEACLQAQRVVSETYDGAHVDPADIQRARIHCGSCAECAAFVKTLAAVRRMPSPTAPETVIESALAKVSEAKRSLDAAAAAAAARAATEAQTAEEAAAREGTREVHPLRAAAAQRIQGLPRWAVYAGWATAAAATLLVAGIVTLQGARYIVQPSQPLGERDALYVSPEPEDTELSGEEYEVGGGDAASVRAGAATSYVTVGEWVYEFVGPENVDPRTTEKIGTTTSALDTSSAPRTLDVLAFGDPEAILLDDGEQLLRFDLVTRSFRRTTYAMQSRPVTAFGQWPSLPERYPEPEDEDGSPVFSRAGTDDSGVPIYATEGINAEQSGFAIAPGTPSSDPAAGNPNWTWWAPLP